MSRWTENLNEEQQIAVLHDYGPMLILAGAGSGKTTTLVARTGRLIDEGVANPENICVLTFTNKAAKELKNRVSKRLPSSDKLWTGTFHSFGVRTIRTYYKQLGLPKYFGIMDQQDSIGLIREILKDFNLQSKDKFDADVLLSQLSRWRETGRVSAEGEGDYDVVAEWLLPKYERKKEILGVVDFDDLILKVIELYKRHPDALAKDQRQFQQLMVDEFQDTNIGQMKLVDMLSNGHGNLSVVGDDDQSIYGWRGAEVQNILNFPKKYKNTQVIRLEKNYRSTPQILSFANESISKNKDRYNKVLKNPTSDMAIGSLPEVFCFETDIEEIDGVIREIGSFKEKGFKNKQIAILYRANAQGAFLEASLRQKNIPYKLSGGTSFLERKEIKDILCYVKCAFRPNDIDFRRIFNTPARGLGDTTVERLVEKSKELNSTFYKCSLNWMATEIAPKTGQSIDALHAFLKQLKQELLNSPESPGTVLLRKMDETGYRSLLRDISKDAISANKRWGIVEVFCRSLDKSIERNGRTLEGFHNFLLALELKDNEDDEKEKEKDEVQLLTLHACKGLEFPCVILMGIEEDILPHKRLGQDVTEERRLFYVGVTRAQVNLILTYSKKRQIHGKWANRVPSRFLEEINSDLFIRYWNGYRPVSSSERIRMLSDLRSKLST